MCICLRITDTTVVVLAGLIFCGVCALVEKQHERDKHEPSSMEDNESHTFDHYLPALSQMDYEVLGSNGFSITDFMQNTNFSSSTKMKADRLSKDKESNGKQMPNLQKISTTKTPKKPEIIPHPLFSTRISQRNSNKHSKENISSSFEESSIINTIDYGMATTDVPIKRINRTNENGSSKATTSTHLAMDSLHNTTNENISFSNNHIQSINKDATVVSSLSHKGRQFNGSNLFNSTILLSASENRTTADYVNASTIVKGMPYLNSTDNIVVTNRTLKLISNLLNQTSTQTETNYLSLSDKNILNCFKQIVKLLSGNSTKIKSITFKPMNNTNSIDSVKKFTINNRSTSFPDLSQSTDLGKGIFSVDQIVSTEFLTEPYAHQTEVPATEFVFSQTKSVWDLKVETSDLTTEHSEDINVNNSKSSKEFSNVQPLPQQTLVPSIVEKDKIPISNTRLVSTLRSELNISPVMPTLPMKSVSTESNNSSVFVIERIKPIHLTPSSTERPQILVNVSGQIRIIRGMIWMYQLNDKESAEYQYYSRKVQRMLEEMFWQTWLAKHIKKIDVHRFRRGSVMVDFRLVVKTERHIQPQEMELLFNSFLLPDGGFGGFQMDRHFTKFEISEPVVAALSPIQINDNSLPQWATALIVISGASLIFVILFGVVTVYGSYPIISSQNHRRLHDEESANGSKQNKINCTDWERKVTAAYENLSADAIYDLDDVGDKKIKHIGGCKPKLENTEA